MTNYSDKPDDILVELTLLGNDQAYGELVTRHEKAVRGTAYKVTNNAFSAEDASQDAFVAAWMRLDTLTDYTKFRAWVCSIAHNAAADLMRRYRSSEAISLDTDLLHTDVPDCAWEDIERSADLHAEVDKLSEKIRETVKLHYFEGYSVKEIARRLSVPKGTVTWRLSEGRRQLRKGYGIMETKYDEKEALVARVLRQVEQLKLWKLKLDKEGFKDEYEAVLKNVDALDDSKEKSYALADVLLMGFWWAPGQKNDEVLARIKKLAEESRNDEAMKGVIQSEIERALQNSKYNYKKLIAFIENEEIPYLEKHGFAHTLSFAKHWLGKIYYGVVDDVDSAKRLWEEIVSVGDKSDVYYAQSLSALKMLEFLKSYDPNDVVCLAAGEKYKIIDGRLYQWEIEEDSMGCSFWWLYSSLWNNMTAFDSSLTFDFNLKPEETALSDGSCLTRLADRERIETPAETFDDCDIYVTQNKYDTFGISKSEAQTAIRPEVGIVYQRHSTIGAVTEYSLLDYKTSGGGMIPLEAGNYWEYEVKADDSRVSDSKYRIEITYAEKDEVIASIYYYDITRGFEDNWDGAFMEMKHAFQRTTDDERWGWGAVCDAEPQVKKLEERAETKSQKRMTAAAADVVRRVMRTNDRLNPDYTEKDSLNYFEYRYLISDGGRVSFGGVDEKKNIEVYHFCGGTYEEMIVESLKVYYHDLYFILNDAVGCVWSDEWKPGLEYEKEFRYYTGKKVTLRFRVEDDETVTTPAGTFENCRHIWLDLAGVPAESWYSYRCGTQEYWFAPGVGMVQFFKLVRNNIIRDMYWQLTDYEGTGEGYFPAGDGFVRRYAPSEIGCGYHAWVEYTFDEDERGIKVIRNAASTLDRKGYEEILRFTEERKKKREKEEAENREQ